MKYIDRKGMETIVNSNQDELLEKLYTCRIGRTVLKVLISPIVSKIGGLVLNSKVSTIAIKPFVKNNHIDLSQYENKNYNSYNDFFTRKIKASNRPIAMEADKLISPCDGKVSVYPIHENQYFCIKHTWYHLESLLHSKKLAERFQGGYACIFRLTVDNYHRYCYMDDGVKSKNYHIRGVFHTVNPIANDFYPIYKENTREFCLLKSEHFGELLIMEVGALLVGKINNYHEKKKVSKGMEKGKFEFGGSTIIVLIEKDRVKIDKDLIENTQNGFETIVKLGEQIGVQC